MKNITANQIAEYIINSFADMYEDGYYYAHYNPETGLNYKGNCDPENISVCVPCCYDSDCDSIEELEGKESIDDPDFMEMCGRLADKLNSKVNE